MRGTACAAATMLAIAVAASSACTVVFPVVGVVMGRTDDAVPPPAMRAVPPDEHEACKQRVHRIYQQALATSDPAEQKRMFASMPVCPETEVVATPRPTHVGRHVGARSAVLGVVGVLVGAAVDVLALQGLCGASQCGNTH